MGKVKGASFFTHALKEYGGGKGMADGIKRIALEQRQQGFRQGMETMIRLLRPGHSADSSKLQRPYWDKAADHPTKIVGKCVST